MRQGELRSTSLLNTFLIELEIELRLKGSVKEIKTRGEKEIFFFSKTKTESVSLTTCGSRDFLWACPEMGLHSLEPIVVILSHSAVRFLPQGPSLYSHTVSMYPIA